MTGARKRRKQASASAVLRARKLLDSVTDAEFDALTRVASLAGEMPFAALGLLDVERTWFKSVVQTRPESNPLSQRLSNPGQSCGLLWTQWPRQ
jgi:hypothetical protein